MQKIEELITESLHIESEACPIHYNWDVIANGVGKSNFESKGKRGAYFRKISIIAGIVFGLVATTGAVLAKSDDIKNWISNNIFIENKQPTIKPNSNETKSQETAYRFIEGRGSDSNKAFESVKQHANFHILAPTKIENNLELTNVLLDQDDQKQHYTLDLKYVNSSNTYLQIWQTPKQFLGSTKNPLSEGTPIKINNNTWYYQPPTNNKTETTFSADLDGTVISIGSAFDYDTTIRLLGTIQCINCK